MNRTFVAGRNALELNGKVVGFLKKAGGGNAKCAVVTEKVGADTVAHKHLAGIEWDDFSVSVGLSSTGAVADWIQQSLDKNYSRKAGALIVMDHKMHEIGRKDFHEALITEVGWPALDASSKEPAYMSIKWKAEKVDTKRGTGAAVKGEYTTAEQKAFLPMNFRLLIPGLECGYVNKVDAFTVKQNVTIHHRGQERLPQIEPGALEIPNLKVTVPDSHVKSFVTWAEDFMVKGNNGAAAEKTGSLAFLSSNLKDELAMLEFTGLGICDLKQEEVEAGSDKILNWTAEFYCETVKLSGRKGIKALG